MATELNLPKHIAIIPDGNRRWARERGLSDLQGHLAGVQRTRELLKVVNRLGIKVMTYWGFSTENWSRSEEEVDYLMNDIFIKQGKKFIKDFYEQEIRFIHIGRKDRISKELLDIISDLEEKTSHFSEKTLCLGIDYGGRDEIVRAARKMIASGIVSEDVNEEVFDSFLDTRGVLAPDMIIRTSGEMRLSGLMPWQSVYAELFFPKEYFPDLTDELFEQLVSEFQKRKRTFGGKR